VEGRRGPPSASSERAGRSARLSAKKRKTDASRDIHLTTDLVQIDCNAMALPVAIRGLEGWHLLHGMQEFSPGFFDVWPMSCRGATH
jgi:hypothetical protein